MFVSWWVIILFGIILVAALTRTYPRQSGDDLAGLGERLDEMDSKLDSIIDHFHIDDPELDPDIEAQDDGPPYKSD